MKCWHGADLCHMNANHSVEEVRRLVNESAAPVRWLGVAASAIAMNFDQGTKGGISVPPFAS